MTSRTLSTTLAIALSLGATAIKAQTEDAVVAVVNGIDITESMIQAYAAQRQQLRGDNAPREQLIGEVVSKELVFQDGLKQGIDNDPELVARLDTLRRDLIIGTALDTWSEANPVSDEDIQAVYDQWVAETQTDTGSEYKARHILLDSEEDAVAVIAELDGGADFAELAKTRSTGPSGPGGGDLGWFRKDSMVAEFSTAAAALDKGSYTKQPVKTQFGWHVILLEDQRPIAPPPLDALRDQIAEQLGQAKLQVYIQDLREAGDVVINE